MHSIYYVRQVGELAQKHAKQHHFSLTPPHEALTLADQLGLHRLLLPQQYDGFGLSSTQMMETVAALGYYDAAFALGYSMTHVALGLTLDFCDPDKRDFFARLAHDHRLCAGFSELATTNDDVFSFEASTIAKKVKGGYKLTGTKGFVSHGKHTGARYMLTSCRETTDRKQAALLVWVDTQAEGYEELSTWDPIGMRSTLSNQVKLTDVFVPDEMVVAHLRHYLASILIVRGDASFGWYSMAYVGGLLRLIDLFEEARPKYHAKAMSWKEQTMALYGDMQRVGDLYGTGEIATASPQLLANKTRLGNLAETIRNGVLRYGGTHVLLGTRGGQTGEFSLILSNLLMVHSMPPADRMIERFQVEGLPNLFA